MCGRLVNLDTVARVLADYYHLKTDAQLAALDEALSRVPAETVGKELFGNSEQLELDTISRAAVVDAIEGVDWYHINKNGEMVHGANPDDHQAWYKAEDIYKAVENVPSAQQWISCEERLPEDYTDVLVWFEYYRYGDYNRLYQTYGIGDYVAKYDSWMINHETGWRKLRVFAWCPLPEPWEGEQE